jgi:hypothetical protein
VETITITDEMLEFQPAQLSDFASDITYIPLETNEESLIQRIDKVMLYRQYCLILDKVQDCVFVFDTLGNYQHKIDKQGKGPGEYLNIWDATVLDDGSICIVDISSQKLIRYSMSGRLLNEKTQIGERSSILGTLDGKYPISLSVYGQFIFNENYMLSVHDTLFNTLNRLVDRSFEKLTKEDERNLHIHPYSFLTNCADTLTFWEYKYDTVYRICDANTCIPRYYFDYKDKLPKAIQSNKAQDYSFIQFFIETSAYFFISIDVHNKTRQLVYHKKTHQGKSMPYVIFENTIAGIMNDLDGGWRFWPRGVVAENRVYDFFSAYDIQKHMDNETWITKNPLNPEKQKTITRIAENATMLDNPVIAIVTCKTQ